MRASRASGSDAQICTLADAGHIDPSTAAPDCCDSRRSARTRPVNRYPAISRIDRNAVGRSEPRTMMRSYLPLP
jgi:hypothetical protein